MGAVRGAAASWEIEAEVHIGGSEREGENGKWKWLSRSSGGLMLNKQHGHLGESSSQVGPCTGSP